MFMRISSVLKKRKNKKLFKFAFMWIAEVKYIEWQIYEQYVTMEMSCVDHTEVIPTFVLHTATNGACFLWHSTHNINP